MTASSLTSSGESGGGAPYGHGAQQQRAAFDPANPFGPLTDLPAIRASIARQDENSSGDNTASVEGQQRGAPL